MKLQDQFISMELAKKLKELGVVQVSLFYHIWNTTPSIGYEGLRTREKVNQKIGKGAPQDAGGIRYYAAFSVAELGQMLPDMLLTHLQFELVCIKEDDDCWICRYVRNNDLMDCHPIALKAAGKTEAEARANALISIIENNLQTAEEINQRLIEG